MSDVDFRNHKFWSTTVTSPEQYDGGPKLSIAWDLGAVPDKDKKKTIARWVQALPTLTQLRCLQIWSHVTQPVFDALCELEELEVLQLKWSNIQHLDAIKRLRQLKALHIGSSTKIQSIEPLTELPQLEILDIENFKLISDFAPLERIRTLRDLSVTGGMWGRQPIADLVPFARMTFLHTLTLDTSTLKSIRALASLTQLKTLNVGGRLPYEDYAWLSAKLPHTECWRFVPYTDASNILGPCPRCKQRSMVMLTGKGKPTLCRHCDKARFDKHVALFEQVRADAVSSP